MVQTGSRKVSSTTLPRRLASETRRPSWLVSVKPGAGVSICPDAPARPAAMIGSAFLFTRGERHRRRADQDHPDRGDRGDGRRR